MLSLDFSDFPANCIHENLAAFPLCLLNDMSQLHIKAVSSGSTLGRTPTRKCQITCNRKPRAS